MFSFLKFFNKKKNIEPTPQTIPTKITYFVAPVNRFTNREGAELFCFSEKNVNQYAVIGSSNNITLETLQVGDNKEINEYLNNLGFSVHIGVRDDIQLEPNIETTCEKIERPLEKQIIEKISENKPNQQISDLIAVAESIKNKRKPSMSAPKPIKVQKYAHYKKALICNDGEGNEYNVGPTTHAIIRFANRYQHIDPLFEPLNERQIENKIREIFNKGSLNADDMFAHRNGKREQSRAKHVIWWKSGDINFVVNLKDKVIITVELIGAHIGFNNVPPRVNYGADFEK